MRISATNSTVSVLIAVACFCLLASAAPGGGFAARGLGQAVNDEAYPMTYADEGFISKEKNQAMLQVATHGLLERNALRTRLHKGLLLL